MSPDGAIPPEPALSSPSPSANRAELWGWSFAGIVALALAGIYAVLLVLSRTPFLEGLLSWPDQFFQKGLVAHVVFSFLVWFLAVFSALALQAGDVTADPSEEPGVLIRFSGRAALAATGLGMILILLSPFIGGGEPSLNNYVPVIINPLYYAGLILIGLGTLTIVLRMLIQVSRAPDPAEPATFLLVTAGIVFLASLAGVLMAYFQLGPSTVDHAYNESLFWGGGHLLQVMNLAFVFVVWDRLGRDSVIGAFIWPRWAQAISLALIAITAIGLSFFGLFGINGDEFREAFTTLQYAFAVPILMVAAALAPRLIRAAKRGIRRDPAGLALITSIVVF
ncbi:MAG: hypothetical protein O3A84_12685, partial [Proteobacteria bacterium]|nr:hypothetical protein [Pseudomonadota bacterium]